MADNHGVPARDIRVAHFINQFFAGRGGEASANEPVGVTEAPVGPGRLLQEYLGAHAHVVVTISGGDNYVAERGAEAKQDIAHQLKEYSPNVLVAGPAFESGRYAFACMLACSAAKDLGIPAVTGFHPANPAALLRQPRIHVVPTTSNVKGMRDALQELAVLALKLAKGGELGPADVEGYLPTGERRFGTRDRSGHVRAMDMLLAKLHGLPYRSELTVHRAPITPASPVDDLRRATISVITTGGLVPTGNPDRMPIKRSERAYPYRYPEGDFVSSEWEAVHSGYSTDIVKSAPTVVVPLDALRAHVRGGTIASFGDRFYSLTGVWVAEPKARQIAQDLEVELRRDGAHAALLVAT